MLTVEERLKNIEDELGLTAKYVQAELNKNLKQPYLDYGFNNQDAKVKHGMSLG